MAKAKEEAFLKADIIANSKLLFGKSPDVVAGALIELTEETTTINRAKEQIENYLTRPINNEGGK